MCLFSLSSSQRTHTHTHKLLALLQAAVICLLGPLLISSCCVCVLVCCLGFFFVFFFLVHNNRVVASPAVGGGKVFVGSDDSKLYCFDQNSGKVLWTFKTGAAVRSSPALAADGSVVFGSYDGSAYRVSGTGKQIWKTSIGGQVCLCCLCNCIALLLFEVGAGVVKRQQWSFMPKCACFCVNPATSSRSRCCCCCCCCRW